MEPTGSLTTLAERLKEKAEQDREQASQIFQKELQVLSSSLHTLSRNELATMTTGITGEVRAASESLHQHFRILSKAYGRAWLRTGLTALAVTLGLCLGTGVTLKWINSRILEELAELSRIETDIQEQRETLLKLQSKTFGVMLRESPEGKFIVLPAGTTPKTGWKLGEQPAIKLE